MVGSGAAGHVLARAALAMAAFGMAVTGIVVGTEGTVFLPPAVPTVALKPAAASLGCDAVGPYHAPLPGSSGLPDGSRLCPSGPVTISVPGAVLDGWDLRGGVVIDAPDVVVRRCRVTGDGSTPYGIVTTGNGSVRIEDTMLTGDFPEAAVGGDRWSGARIEVVGVSHDGVQLGVGARLRNSVLRHFGTAPGADADAVVLTGGADLLVEDNRIELGTGPGRGSAVLLAPQAPARRAEGPVVIRGNVLGGGRYTVRQDGGAPDDVRITGNRFLRDAEQGPLRVSSRAVLADNTYVDGGPLRER